MPGTWWPRRCSARISGMPSSAIQVLWPCLSPCDSQAWLDGEPAGDGCAVGDGLDAPAAGWGVVRGWACGWPGGDGNAGPGGRVGDDELRGSAFFGFVASVAGGAEHAAGVVAAPVVAAVGAEEDVSAAAALLGGAAAGWMRVVLDLAGEQVGQERRQVDRETRLPGRAAVGVVLGREPVEPAVEFAELPLDVDLAGVECSRVRGRSPRPSAGRCTRW